jgi:uncharacterized membrane protein YdjX (TVP38/TMEM64 family)
VCVARQPLTPLQAVPYLAGNVGVQWVTYAFVGAITTIESVIVVRVAGVEFVNAGIAIQIVPIKGKLISVTVGG